MNYNRQYSPQRPNPPETSNVDEKRIEKILGGDAFELNKYAEELAQSYLQAKEAEKLSTSQIRAILTEIQKMKEFNPTKLQLLRPKLAYAAGRHKGKVKEFRDLLEALIKKANQDNFDTFKNFVEAIVAYHKYHGGK
jgi:CRISPR-associated protein Csm2